MGDFEVKIEHSGQKKEIAVLSVNGDLDFDSVPAVNQSLAQLFQEGYTKIVMNLSGLQYTNSAGIGLIISSMKQCQARGGDLKLAQVPKNIFELFELTEMTEVFSIYSTVEDAVNSYY